MHPPIRSFKIVATLTLMTIASVLDAQTPIKESPFLPPANSGTPATPGATAYELTGMSVAGKATLLSITRVRDKRSVWVPVGKSSGEITAISYDPKTDQATIRAEGKVLTLTMRKSAVVSGPSVSQLQPQPSSAPVATKQGTPAPPVAIPPPPANAQEEKETEARMLVTDLLEIGQQQRKAYEEAQRQAAAKGTKPSPTPAPKPPGTN